MDAKECRGYQRTSAGKPCYVDGHLAGCECNGDRTRTLNALWEIAAQLAEQAERSKQLLSLHADITAERVFDVVEDELEQSEGGPNRTVLLSAIRGAIAIPSVTDRETST